MPRGPAGTTEVSRPTKPSSYRYNGRINQRTLIAPAAAFTMACLLFVYTRTSIRAAKANAQRHRDADSGGQGLDLYNESRRRHGLADKVESDKYAGNVGELASHAREQLLGKKKSSDDEEETKKLVSPNRREPENKLKAAMGKRRDDE